MPTAISADGVQHQFPDGTDPSVIDGVMKQYAQTQAATNGPTWAGALQGGAHDALVGLGAGAHALGAGLSAVGLPETASAVDQGGDWLNSQATNIGTPNESAPDPIGDVGAGNYGTALSDLGKSALRMGVGASPAIAAGMVGGPLAAGAVTGVTGEGSIAEQRAANNGRDKPSGEDYAWALPGAAGSAVAGAFLPGVGKGIAGRVAGDAIAGAGMDLAGQVGGSAGTDKGLSVDPKEIGNVALSGGALGAGLSAPRIAGTAVKPITDRIMAAQLEDPSDPEFAASNKRTTSMADQAQAAAGSADGKPLDRVAAFNNVKDTVRSQTLGYAAQLADAGLLDPADVREIKAMITNRAAVGKNDFTGDDLARLKDILSGLPMEASQPLVDGLLDLNTASRSAFLNQQVGPLQMAGQIAGRVAAPVLELAHGSPMGALAALGITGGHGPMGGIAGRIGAAAGSVGDRLLGLRTTTADLTGRNADAVLQKAGIDPSTIQGDTIKRLLAARAGLDDAQTQMGQGAQPAGKPVTPAEDTAQSIADQQAQEAVDKQGQQAAQLRQTQTDQMVRQKAQQDAQTEAAWSQQGKPQVAPEAAAWDAGKLQDPSLAQGSGTGLTLAQEVALWGQHLANQRALDKNAQAQQDVIDAANGDTSEARGQAAADKRAKANDTALAAAGAGPTPGVDPDAQLAATLQVIRKAAAIRRLAGVAPTSPDPDTGLPTDGPALNAALPNASAPGPQAPQGPSQLVVDTPEGVRSTQDADGLQAAPTAAQRLSQAQSALAARRPGWSTFVADSDPAITHKIAMQAFEAADKAGELDPEVSQLIRSGHTGPIMGDYLTPIQNRARGMTRVSDSAQASLDRSATANQAANKARLADQQAQQKFMSGEVDKTVKAATDERNRTDKMREASYQKAMDTYHKNVSGEVARLIAEGNRQGGHDLTHVSMIPLIPDKQAYRASLPPARAKAIPDWAVSFGGKPLGDEQAPTQAAQAAPPSPTPVQRAVPPQQAPSALSVPDAKALILRTANALGRGSGKSPDVRLADVRAALPQINRQTFDAALTQLHEGLTQARLLRIENTRAETPADKRDGLPYKGNFFHIIWPL